MLDVKLPNVDGFDVLKRIKAQYPTTAVAIITGMYDEQIDAFVRAWARWPASTNRWIFRVCRKSPTKSPPAPARRLRSDAA